MAGEATPSTQESVPGAPKVVEKISCFGGNVYMMKREPNPDTVGRSNVEFLVTGMMAPGTYAFTSPRAQVLSSINSHARLMVDGNDVPVLPTAAPFARPTTLPANTPFTLTVDSEVFLFQCEVPLVPVEGATTEVGADGKVTTAGAAAVAPDPNVRAAAGSLAAGRDGGGGSDDDPGDMPDI